MLISCFSCYRLNQNMQFRRLQDEITNANQMCNKFLLLQPKIPRNSACSKKKGWKLWAGSCHTKCHRQGGEFQKFCFNFQLSTASKSLPPHSQAFSSIAACDVESDSGIYIADNHQCRSAIKHFFFHYENYIFLIGLFQFRSFYSNHSSSAVYFIARQRERF